MWSWSLACGLLPGTFVDVGFVIFAKLTRYVTCFG